MSEDIRAGDVVVCVDAKPNPLAPPDNVQDTLKLREGRLYRVRWAGSCPQRGFDLLRLEGVRNGGWSKEPAFERGYYATRFRKIDAADEQFTQSVRACRPIKQGADA